MRSWRAAYADIIPAEELRRVTLGSSVAVLDRSLRRGQLVLVAEEPSGRELVGYAIAGRQYDRRLSRFRGEVFELYVEPAAQRRGVGRALLTEAIWQLITTGCNPAIVWVLARNPARFFYQACGGTFVARDALRFGSFVTSRLAFGWSEALPLPGLHLVGADA